MKKPLLEGFATLVGSLCFFGVPLFAMGLIAWAGDTAIALLPIDPQNPQPILYTFEAIGVLLGISIATFALCALLFVLLRKLSMGLQARADSLIVPIDENPGLADVQAKRVRVGFMASKKGMGSVRDLRRKYTKVG